MQANGTKKIVVADTSFLIRKGLRAVIEENPLLELAGEVNNDKDLKSSLAKVKPDILVVDHCCDECFSVKTIRSIKQEYPQLAVLVISHEHSIDEIKKVLNLGIKNYVLKDSSEEEINEALLCCVQGKKYFCKEIVSILLDNQLAINNQHRNAAITIREMEIIRELIKGLKTNQVADTLNISSHTVITHKKNIYKKLGIKNSIELMQYALKTKLLES